MNYRKAFRVAPDSRVQLKDSEPQFVDDQETKKSARAKTAKLSRRMDKLQFQLYAEQADRGPRRHPQEVPRDGRGLEMNGRERPGIRRTPVADEALLKEKAQGACASNWLWISASKHG